MSNCSIAAQSICLHLPLKRQCHCYTAKPLLRYACVSHLSSQISPHHDSHRAPWTSCLSLLESDRCHGQGSVLLAREKVMGKTNMWVRDLISRAVCLAAPQQALCNVQCHFLSHQESDRVGGAGIQWHAKVWASHFQSSVSEMAGGKHDPLSKRHEIISNIFLRSV